MSVKQGISSLINLTPLMFKNVTNCPSPCIIIVSVPELTRFPGLTAVFTSLQSTTDSIFLEVQCLVNFFQKEFQLMSTIIDGTDFNLLLFKFKNLDVLQKFLNSGVDFLWHHQNFRYPVNNNPLPQCPKHTALVCLRRRWYAQNFFILFFCNLIF